MNTPIPSLPADHSTRMERVRRSLDGLSVGDALGQQYFYFPELIASRTLPADPWHFTDDTVMASSIAEVLHTHGAIHQDVLAQSFGRHYREEPHRGYGGTAHGILREFSEGGEWRKISRSAFGGNGSMGNGGAMRSAPVGAYFADDLGRAAHEARLSAEVTHAHPEGQAGAVAIAVAAAVAVGLRHQPAVDGSTLLEPVLEWTPDGATREGIARALELSAAGTSVELAVAALGNGSALTSPDTVPFALWCAARHTHDFTTAFWTTVSGLGDRDTTCAIVGGIVGLSASRGIPHTWLLCREPLPPIV